MKTMLERKIQFAILCAQQEILRKFVVDYSKRREEDVYDDHYFSPIEQLFYNFVHKTDKFEKTQFNDIPQTIYLSGVDKTVEHDEIDKALNKKFVNGIVTDSETCQFHCDCNVDNLETVSEFLKANFPNLNFGTQEKDRKRIFVNQFDWEKFLKEQDVTVPNPIPQIVTLQIAVEEEKAKLEAKIKSMEKELIIVADTVAERQMTLVDDKVKEEINELVKGCIERGKAQRMSDSESDDYFRRIELPEIAVDMGNIFKQDWYNLKRCVRLVDYKLNGVVGREFYTAIREYFAKKNVEYKSFS